MKKSISTLLTVLFFIAPCSVEVLAGNNETSNSETQIVSLVPAKTKVSENEVKSSTEAKNNNESVDKTGTNEKVQAKLDKKPSVKQNLKRYLGKTVTAIVSLLTKAIDHSLAALPHILIKFIV